ncbi:fungal specific transcription factor [Hirsutella rhossiliensis]|uniref:Fungal specific transcription factor domain-containing protein n=1 Tax=Hirsutella rhossiliensis TaxID=111463 RepID=A0A9P8SJ48_9HYPO|nr:fungal specific transcription factor domain-containing protein [Hirsutella rhossiliensis]KAH0962691.1 fungal specific transcription factor domain-containing protein [Hirsutella rhossiliensis]
MADDKKCWECLKRRHVCDRSRPSCKKCGVRGINCPGYDHKPLKWMAPCQTKAKRRGADPPIRRGERLAVAPALDVCPEATQALEAIEYYNINICPDLLTTGAAGSGNPFFTSPKLAHELPPTILQILASSAVGHRILQSSPRPRSEIAVLTTKLQVHRGESFRLLAQAMAQPASQISDETLVSILVLLLAEIQQSVASFTWRLHLDGASAIIRERGGLPGVFLSRPIFRHLLRYFVLVDVMGSTTAPCVEAERARRQLELVPLLPDLFGDGLLTCFPCAPELLQDIIANALPLLQRIRRFSALSWAADVKMAMCCAREDVSSRTGAAETSSWDWQRIARIYQAAVALYCVSSVLGCEVSGSRESKSAKSYKETCAGVSGMRLEYCSALVHDLRAVAASSNLQLRKMTIWPLMVAGIEVDTADEAAKRFIGDELAWISSAVGIASPLPAEQNVGEFVR